MIPKHICYCEPFGGAGWVLFEKQSSDVMTLIPNSLTSFES
nr:hypothetical protein [Desulfosporosinus sp. OT]